MTLSVDILLCLHGVTTICTKRTQNIFPVGRCLAIKYLVEIQVGRFISDGALAGALQTSLILARKPEGLEALVRREPQNLIS